MVDAMKHLLVRLLVGFALLIPVQGPAATAPFTLMVFGDSLSANYGIEESQGWVTLLESRLLEQALPIEVINGVTPLLLEWDAATGLFDLYRIYYGNDGEFGTYTPHDTVASNVLEYDATGSTSGWWYVCAYGSGADVAA